MGGMDMYWQRRIVEPDENPCREPETSYSHPSASSVRLTGNRR